MEMAWLASVTVEVRATGRSDPASPTRCTSSPRRNAGAARITAGFTASNAAFGSSELLYSTSTKLWTGCKYTTRARISEGCAANDSRMSSEAIGTVLRSVRTRPQFSSWCTTSPLPSKTRMCTPSASATGGMSTCMSTSERDTSSATASTPRRRELAAAAAAASAPDPVSVSTKERSHPRRGGCGEIPPTSSPPPPPVPAAVATSPCASFICFDGRSSPPPPAPASGPLSSSPRGSFGSRLTLVTSQNPVASLRTYSSGGPYHLWSTVRSAWRVRCRSEKT
mmetsp:Transcript_2616/g.9581  ORF Transcript_2616/g.9581 Transcript_2616/m.9581 type:complete len:281 (-) Transcript_2616:779-1621(-)